MAPLAATGPKIYATNTTTALSDSYNNVQDTINYLRSIKLKIYQGENVTYFCAEILVDAERLEIEVSFNPGHLGYITFIFEDTSDSIFFIWKIQKYKNVIEFIKNICLYDKDVIQPEEIIIYQYLVQQDKHKYCYLFDSKKWYITADKDKYQEQIFIPKA